MTITGMGDDGVRADQSTHVWGHQRLVSPANVLAMRRMVIVGLSVTVAAVIVLVGLAYLALR